MVPKYKTKEEQCVNQLSMTVAKPLRNHIKEEKFTVAHGFGGLSPWPAALWFLVYGEADITAGSMQ